MSYMLLTLEPVGQRAERTEAEGRARYAAMQAFGEGLAREGKLRAVESLASQDGAARVTVTGGHARVVDGPFPETKELIAGWTLIRVRTRDAALEWSRRFPNPMGRGREAVVEVRQLFEMDEFTQTPDITRMRAIETPRKEASA